MWLILTVDITTIFDGQIYNPGDSLPDMGSWVCTSVDKNANGEYNIRNYEGLSTDIDKLPHYENLGTGSSALCLDTSELYKYEKSTDIWYNMSTSGIGGGEPGDGYANLVADV